MQQRQAERAGVVDSPGVSYTTVSLYSILTDSRPKFDIFIRAESGGEPVLYAGRNTRFGDEHRDRLLRNNVEEVLIDWADQASYRDYVESNLVQILADPAVASEEKAGIIQEVSRGVVETLFENANPDTGFRRTASLARSAVDFMFSDRSSVRHLVMTASYDYDIFSHSVNTFVYAVALARRVQLGTPKQLGELGCALLMRDIGLTQLDRAVWDSGRDQHRARFEIFKRHPVIGEEMLAKTGRYSPMQLDVVRHHHEKADGTGYPDGLSGGEISPFVSVSIIANTFDSLSTNRENARGKGTYGALRAMSAELHEEFDPRLFRAFVGMMGNPD